MTVDHSIDQIRARTLQLMQRGNRPDGIVSGAGGATFALVAGIEDAGLKLGVDVDIVSKQSSNLLHLFRPQIYVVNEDIRLAGRELARSVVGSIGGAPPQSLQSLSQPGPVRRSTLAALSERLQQFGSRIAPALVKAHLCVRLAFLGGQRRICEARRQAGGVPPSSPGAPFSSRSRCMRICAASAGVLASAMARSKASRASARAPELHQQPALDAEEMEIARQPAAPAARSSPAPLPGRAPWTPRRRG